MNPIEKHKSEIEKRISQLQQKFNKERGIDHSNGRKMREYIPDQNKIYGNPMQLSKTMEVKSKNRGGEIARLKKNYGNDSQSRSHNDILAEIDAVKNVAQKQAREDKDYKIKELQNIVKSLLEGQKTLQKQLKNLKTKNNKEQMNQIKVVDQLLQPSIKCVTNSLQKPKHQNSQKDSVVHRKKQIINPNSSLLISENNPNKRAGRQQRNPRKTSAISIKKKDFEELYQQLKQRNRQQKRYLVEQQWKSRIWNEVECRVRESDKQYKDTMHRNNKHEFQHLMSTFQLQRKLKDDLINKVYQQCNDQIFK